MDIQKEKKAIKNLKAFYMEDWNLTEEERDDLDNLVSRIVAVVKTEAQAVPEGFVLVSAEQMSQWGYMANCAEEYGCPECFEARGYAHSLACEINEFFAIEAQEPAND